MVLITVVAPDEAKARLAPLSVDWLWGVGPKKRLLLHQIGLQTIEDVASADPEFMLAKLGKAGLHFHALAHAEDSRAVTGHRAHKIRPESDGQFSNSVP